MPFLITGCGRSGTGYVSALLNNLGIPTAHERVFLPDHRRPWGDFAGDVSWFGVPFLHQILREDVVVIHLVRHPIACGRSYAGLRFFHGTADDFAEGHYSRPVWTYDRSIFDFVEPHARFGAFWVRWNLAVELHARATVRSESLVDPDAVVALTHALDHPCPRDRAVEALAATDPQTHHGERDDSLSWESFPARLRTLVHDMALRYGYERV